MKRFLTTVIPAALALSSSAAFGQEAMVEGPGVKIGEATVLRPHIGLEAGVVSNVFFEAANAAVAPMMRLIAGIDITPSGEDRLGSGDQDSAPAPKVSFRGGVGLEYQEYLSSNSDVQSQRNLGVDALGDLRFFPKSNASFGIQDKFQRLNRPTNFESTSTLTRDVNHAILDFGIHPRGHTLTGDLRYENTIDVFESADSRFADRLQQIIGAKANWKFFPYSQVWIDASFGFYGALGSNTLQGMPYKIDSNPLRLIAGIDTVLTEKTTLKAYAGYANGFYAAGPSYNSPVGGVSYGWRYLPTGRVEGSYSYDVHDSINSNYYGDHHIGVNVVQGLGPSMLLSGGAGVRFRGYHGTPVQFMGNLAERDDLIFDTNFRFAWMLADRFSLYGDLVLASVSTDYRLLTSSPEANNPSYFRSEVTVGAAAAF